jgi:hypothetical protein
MSTVDVVVPCYNYAHYLPICVQSILSQEGVDVRVLIVNDCSPDDTEAVGQRLAAADPRVTYVKNEKNLGLIGTANRGMIEWASADYSLLLSADDALAPGALARAAALMDANPQVGMVYGLAIIFADDRVIGRTPDPGPYETLIVPGEQFIQFSCDAGNHVPTPTAVVRTKVQQAVGGYLPELPYTSDFEMWMRIALRADVGVIQTVQGYYRAHNSQMSGTVDRAGDLSQCLRTVTMFTDAHAAEIGDPERLLDGIRRYCATEALHQAHTYFESGDAAGVAEYVAFAESHGVPMNELGPWKTLQAKQMFGLGGYKAARPLIEFVRGRRRRRAPQRAVVDPLALKVFGRWPALRDRPAAAPARSRQPSI